MRNQIGVTVTPKPMKVSTPSDHLLWWSIYLQTTTYTVSGTYTKLNGCTANQDWWPLLLNQPKFLLSDICLWWNVILGCERNGLLFGDWNTTLGQTTDVQPTKVVMTDYSSSQVTTQWPSVLSIMPAGTAAYTVSGTYTKKRRMLATKVVLTVTLNQPKFLSEWPS
jgi:hypothetical protein